ncbi:MAG: TonB-dependent receptor, partial [Bacteroidetes bacterium]
MYARLILLCAGLLSSLGLQAQDWSLMGRLVHQTDSSALQGAEVFLWQAGQSPTGKITNERGLFRFDGLSAGDYGLEIRLAGFDTLRQAISLSRERTFLGVIALSPRSYALDQVRIEAERAAGQQKGDTTEFNASAFTTNPDATAEQLVQKLPGVMMQNGQVTAQGEQVQQVLVDGRPFFGNDPSAALRNLPAEVVDKIQVFDQQSEQAQATGFDDGNTTKTMNIITRPETRNGTFGRAYAGYGTDARYKLGTSLNFFQGDRRISIVGQTNNINQQ